MEASLQDFRLHFQEFFLQLAGLDTLVHFSSLYYTLKGGNYHESKDHRHHYKHHRFLARRA